MAESKRDYYEVLGAPRDADENVSKKTYRKLTKKYHSNANPGGKEVEAKFKEASEAHSVLSDLREHQQYGQFGHAASEQGGVGAGGSSGGFGDFDFGEDMGNIFGDIFGDIFGGGRSGRVRSGPSQGASTKTPVRIMFEGAVFGCDREIETNFKEACASRHGAGAKAGTSPQTCSRYNGKGKIMCTQQSFFGTVQNVQTCPDCNDTGQIIKEECPSYYGTGYKTACKRSKVSIPTDVDNGQCMRLAGGGGSGTDDGKCGDSLVEAVVSQHPIFKCRDTSIYSTVPMSSVRAALGGPARIKTVDDEVEYDVKPGIQTDTKVCLEGKGIPSLRSRSARDDHYVTLVVQMSERMNQAQKDALRRFDDVMNGAASPGEEKPRKKGIFKQNGKT